MDFFLPSVKVSRGKEKIPTLYPNFVVGRSDDLMVQGKSVYAIWDEEAGMWSTNEYDVPRLVDKELRIYAEKHGIEHVEYMRSFDSQAWTRFKKFVALLSDSKKQLDEKLTFQNTVVKKSDYVSRRLPYSRIQGDTSAWDELIGTLYSPSEKAKIEWAIGAVVSGDSIRIQKFLVLFGPPGAGKGTVLDIIMKLFEGYTTTFEAKALAGNSNAFATEMFKGNPLVAVQHDGDLSRIEDNSKLNSIISHEAMTINEKHKPTYTARVNAFLFMGTNSPVKISDAKSGLIRRLIDVVPTGNKLPPNQYHALMARIDFELGAIAHHCLNVYRDMGKNYYNTYRPLEMMYQTDVFFGFINANWDMFKFEDGVTLQRAYDMYKEFCADSGIDKPLPRHKIRAELMSYFEEFHDRITIDGEARRSYYKGFKTEHFKEIVDEETKTFSLVMDETTSLLNLELAEMPAQYSKANGTPAKYWSDAERMINGELKKPRAGQVVDTLLQDLDPYKEHYVKVPENHIVIDFDLKDEEGNKSLELNLAAASEWPATYAELSKGGNGVHLHYIYDGDVTTLAPVYSEGIEVKTLLGDASLRRRLSKCNNVPVAHINSGLPFKEKAKVLPEKTIQTERGLRALVEQCLKKKHQAGTKPNVDFIHHILEEAWEQGLEFDLTDLKPRIIAFATNSSNNRDYCLRRVQTMKLKSDSEIEASKALEKKPETRLVYFDVEVYPNLFVICWKYAGSDNVVTMINPSPEDVEQFIQAYKLVGFNNRKYDNHILYARYMGYSLEALYNLSQKIINNVPGALFGVAYNLSYADIYDYSSKKQTLKKFGIEFGMHHMEMDLPWDQPVPEELWPKVVEYCCNDVNLTEATAEDRKQDFVARQILAELSGLTINDTTQAHTKRLIFGNERNPQRSFVYTDLSTLFPGYVFDKYATGQKSTYRGEDPSEGGYVHAEPGMYEDVEVWDVASMHPSSIIHLNLFGDQYTPRFKALVDARLAVKHAAVAHAEGDAASAEYHLGEARKMMDGKLAPYLTDIEGATALAYALKIIINIVYGLTSAKFDNAFRDHRNVDNIVAKMGALFMIDVKHMVQEAGYSPVHIKTDSIKIPGAPTWLTEQIVEYGEKFGYTFEQEKTYSQMCLVNDAVFIARIDTPTLEGFTEKWIAENSTDEEEIFRAWVENRDVKWSTVGAQFQHPYVFKKLFSGEEITFDDMCETKQVKQGHMYLDFTKDSSRDAHDPDISDGGGMVFVGRTGRFVPVKDGFGGAALYRVHEGKPYAVTGTKGYLWLEAEMVKTLMTESNHVSLDPWQGIDTSYFDAMVESARKTIDKVKNGDYNKLVR